MHSLEGKELVSVVVCRLYIFLSRKSGVKDFSFFVDDGIAIKTSDALRTHELGKPIEELINKYKKNFDLDII